MKRCAGGRGGWKREAEERVKGVSEGTGYEKERRRKGREGEGEKEGEGEGWEGIERKMEAEEREER